MWFGDSGLWKLIVIHTLVSSQVEDLYRADRMVSLKNTGFLDTV